MNSKALYNLKELIDLRRHFHKHAESSLKEFETSKKLKEVIREKLGDDVVIIEMVVNGFILDVRGKGAVVSDGKDKIIAFRADIDGLLMKEDNPDLPYQSVTDSAHMCGHDGHMVCLLGGLFKLTENINKLPSNRIARFIFQPAEEVYGGAEKMIKEGCLAGVDEIWGFHNVPWDPIGKVHVKEGAMFAGVRHFCIKAEGEGGHSSLKKQLKNPVLAMSQFNVWLEEALETEFKEENEKTMTFCLPKFVNSPSMNVIPNTASLEGHFRTLDSSLFEKMGDCLRRIGDRVEQKFGVKVSISIVVTYKVLMNNKALTDSLKQIVPDCTEKGVPVMAG